MPITTDVLSSNLDQGEVYNIMWYSLSVTCDRFSPDPPVSSTNKTDRHDITEMLLKVALNIIKQTKKQTNSSLSSTDNHSNPVFHRSVIPSVVVFLIILVYTIITVTVTISTKTPLPSHMYQCLQGITKVQPTITIDWLR